MLDKINQTAEYIRSRVSDMPKTAIILGTGLGALVDHIEDKQYIPYKEIPNFPVSTVEGHSGNLIFGKLGNKRVMAMQGRFHYYEGYDMKQVTFPIRVMKALGIKTLFVSNHGKNYDELGPRFPDMSEAYSRRLVKQAMEIAVEKGIRVMHGVYVGTQGPTFETPAEYRYFHIIGGDAVGMSTVPEVIVARHAGIEVFGVSVITDLGVEGVVEEVSHEEVQKAAQAAQPKMMEIMTELVNRFEE